MSWTVSSAALPAALTPLAAAEVVHDHLGAVPGHLHRVAAADAVARAGDDRYLAVEQPHGSPCVGRPECGDSDGVVRTRGLYIPPREHPHRTPRPRPARDRARGRAPGRRPVARRRGDRRPRHPASPSPQLDAAVREAAQGLRRHRAAAGRPGVGVGAEHPPVDRRRPRALRRRRRARAAQHALQGHRGRARAAHVGRALPLHRHRLPRHQLRRAARRRRRARPGRGDRDPRGLGARAAP